MLQIWHLGRERSFISLSVDSPFFFSFLPEKVRDVLQGIRNYSILHVYYNQHIHLINTQSIHLLSKLVQKFRTLGKGYTILSDGENWVGEKNPIGQG